MSKELEQAELLFKQFKHKEAYPLFEKLADAGEARAMYFMGIYSRLYLGVGHFDQEKSYNWFKKGMEAGDVLCAISYGYLLPKEKRDAFMKEWLPKAEKLAEAGDVFALDDTADCYFYGIGTKADEEKGLANIDKAAEAGYWLAMLTRQHSMMKAATGMWISRKRAKDSRLHLNWDILKGIIVWHSTTSRVLAKNGM